MKLSIGWEQAVYVLLMLNLLSEHSVMTSKVIV